MRSFTAKLEHIAKVVRLLSLPEVGNFLHKLLKFSAKGPEVVRKDIPVE
jgi:hypothetical protein